MNLADWQAFAESVTDYAFILLDPENRVTGWNAGAERIFGYGKDAVVGQTAELVFVPEDRTSREPMREIEAALRDGKVETKRWQLRSDGTRFRAKGVLTPVRDHSGKVTGFAKVISIANGTGDPGDQATRWQQERNALLKEVHHRVKNNLQMITSLINLQAARVSDKSAAIAFEETQTRVRAIAAVHESLYASADFSAIHVEAYLRALVRELQRTFSTGSEINVKLEVAELALEIGKAVPVALIVNELLCNAFLHAFPSPKRGELLLKLSYTDHLQGLPSKALIQVCDTGIGLPANVDFATNDSLGFDLVRLLVTQLRAEVDCDTGASGTRFRISFPLSTEN